jgi:hypothetical protein
MKKLLLCLVAGLLLTITAREDQYGGMEPGEKEKSDSPEALKYITPSGRDIN